MLEVHTRRHLKCKIVNVNLESTELIIFSLIQHPDELLGCPPIA